MCLLMAALSVAGCGESKDKTGAVKQDTENTSAAPLSVESGVEELGKAEFKAKVYDFEKNGDAWKYEGTLPAIVDFYATWCGPCKQLSPILAELASEYAGKIVVYKVDVDKETELATAFGVSSIPMLLWIPAQGEPFVSMGLMPKEELKKAIGERLLK